MSDNFVSITANHDVGSDPILLPRLKLNKYLPPLIKTTKANVLLTPNRIFKCIDKQTYNYCTIASSLSSPVVFVLDQLDDIEIETKEKELFDRLEQENQKAWKIANQLCKEEDDLSMKQQTKKKKNLKNNKQMSNNITTTPELIRSKVNIISSPSLTTTNEGDQQNVPTWCDSKYIEENDLDNIQFEHDEVIDDRCDNNKEVSKDNLLKKDIKHEDSVVHRQYSQDQFEQILRRFDQMDHKFVQMNQKLHDIYEYLSSDRIINVIQRKFFVELPEPLCSRTYSASTSNQMHRLFAAFGLQFQGEYEDLWLKTYPRSIRPCCRPDCIQIDLFGFAHLQTNTYIPSITSPNFDPVNSYTSYTILKEKEKEFRANQIIIGEITTSCLDFECTTPESIVETGLECFDQCPNPANEGHCNDD
ncbi:unnamed protein product [Rotaria sordida]|uniref:Uncharacterized protein n=1 Tax=Rotaria sordida TaxID=392033 RepID=A0A819GAC8_9BILA|nr:unnamed protein product [Rotaria sordida]CAF3882316.1 unnamed protein product [Rotaria sordida]